MDVLIFYEHKAREYPVCCALKAELDKRGIRSVVCHNTGPGLWRYRLFTCPRVVICPSTLETEIGKNWSCLDNYTSFLFGTARFLVNLQVEQLFPDENDEKYNIIQKSEWKERIIYICWGEKRKRQLLAKGVEEKQLVVAGAAHLDFLALPLRSCYKKRTEIAKIYEIDPFKRWNIFVSSYTYADIPEKELRWIIQTRGQIEESAAADIYTMAEVSQRSRTITLEWIERYLLECPEEIFIYRPHPGEHQNRKMREMVCKFPGRFFMIASEPLQQWLLVTDIIDLWLSTTIVDVWKVKKPCVLVQPMLPPDYFVPETVDCTMAVRNYESFKKAHQSREGVAAKYFPGKQEVMEDAYSFFLRPAYKSICDMVGILLEKDTEETIPTKFKWRSIFTKWYIKQVLIAFFACWRVKPSRLLPFIRGKFQPAEEEALERDDIFFCDSEKELYHKIRKIVLAN